MKKLDDVMARISPCPQRVKLINKEEVQLYKGSKFDFSALESNSAVVNIAIEKMKTYLETYCGDDCFQTNEQSIKLTMDIGDTIEDIPNVSEGYRIHVAPDAIQITGYGEEGLLYGVLTFCQLWNWNDTGATIPALEIEDWPDKKTRGLLIESRYGTNLMEKEDWIEMLDNMLEKKMNMVYLCLYGCWVVQYDGRPSEFLYFPVEGHPELESPMTVKYYSPHEKRWIEYDQLPPLFRDNFFGELVKYGKERGITVMPLWNSFGHNTLIPVKIPSISAKEEDGTPTLTGFCTANEDTYKFLFSVYDQLIDNYLLPNGVTAIGIGMDEVYEQAALNANDIFKRRSPWCKCEKCRDKTHGQIFVEHIIRLAKYLKEKGMTDIAIYGDMLLDTRKISIGCAGELEKAIKENHLDDVIVVNWWTYFDVPERLYFTDIKPQLGLRSTVMPWTGYYNWSLLTNPLKNIQMLAEMGHKDHAEGITSYSSWDKSYDRMYDAVAEYSWNYEKTGSTVDVTKNYAKRHFPSRAAECERAFRMIDFITEERISVLDNPSYNVISNYELMVQKLSYYPYSYVKKNKEYPRNLPGEGLEFLMENRETCERALYAIVAMANEAREIFEQAGEDEACDKKMAKRYAYECENYLCLAEDWLALMKMHDMTQNGSQKQIAKLALERHAARLHLMAHCEERKEKYLYAALSMRNHSIFLQMFADIANYVEQDENAQLDMMNTKEIMSERFWELR